MPRKTKEQPPSFEQALEQLDTMVETMESGHLPLEELIANYERGAKLINHCETVLDDARKRLELITLQPPNKDNQSAAEATPTETPSILDNDDDEIRLF